MIHDENGYLFLCGQLLNQPTPNEHTRASRIASQMDHTHPNTSNDPLVNSKLLKRQQYTKLLNPSIIHYTHKKRFAHY